MVLCSTKKTGYGKTETRDPIRRARTQSDPELGTSHVIVDFFEYFSDSNDNSKREIRKRIGKMQIRREELSQKLRYCYIHICHLTCNFGYFLLEKYAKRIYEPIQI